MITLEEWAVAVNGRAIDLDGLFGPQCVDLVNDYIRRVWGHATVRGNAVDFALPGHVPNAFWTRNLAANKPDAGAIVVWGSDGVLTHQYGHVAVALAATPLFLLTMDQNWNGRSEARMVCHTYQAVLGWWLKR